jgi:hypothetical protein
MKHVTLGSVLRAIMGRQGRVSKYKAVVDRIHREEVDAVRSPPVRALRELAPLAPGDRTQDLVR